MFAAARPLVWFAAVLAAAVAGLAALAEPLWLATSVAAAAGLGLAAFVLAAHRHFDDLKLLQAGLDAVAAGRLPPEELTRRYKGHGGLVMGRLFLLAGQIAAFRTAEQARPDQRLAAVLGGLTDGVAVITELGLVSLVNAAAKNVLGGGRAAAGTSIYAALDRDGLSAALAAARAAGKPVAARLETTDGRVLDARVADFGEHRGAVLTFAAADLDRFGGVEMALDLHETPPEAPPPEATTLLSALPVTVLDTETTGLDSSRDRIVSVGAVRVHGKRLYRSAVLDLLVHPGRPIPARASAVHGITDAMVAGHPPIAEALPAILEMLKGKVVVGYNIGFDLTILKRSAAEAGLAWPEPQRLDLILLAGALDPEESDLNLEAIAARLGVDATGRHTALGDSLVTAELFLRLLPVLEREGVRTLGEAMAFSARPRHIVAQQKLQGWT